MDIAKRLPLALSIAALLISATGTTLVIAGCCADSASPAAAREVFGQNSQSGYSAASRYGDLVFTAGHLALSKGADITRQTEEVLAGLQRTLQQAGADFDTVLMTNVYLADFNDWEAFNVVYRQHFTRKLPPRTTVEIGRLGGDGKIEISMVAHVRSK